VPNAIQVTRRNVEVGRELFTKEDPDMRVVTDTGRCVGAGQCALTEPAVFDQSDEDGTVVLLTEHVEGDIVPNVEEAADLCPSQAISLVKD
jgi:ferredoxin